MNTDILDYTYKKINELEKKLELYKALCLKEIPTTTSQLLNDGNGTEMSDSADPYATVSQIQDSGKCFGGSGNWQYIIEKWKGNDSQYLYYSKLSTITTAGANYNTIYTLPYNISSFVNISITQMQTSTTDNAMFQTMCNTKLTLGCSVSNLTLTTRYENGSGANYAGSANAGFCLSIEGFITQDIYLAMGGK